jgi:hypothetical protein
MRAFLVLATILVPAISPVAGTVSADPGDGKTVVELFTSQSCYSCPPAEAYLGELAERGDVIALEYHVDYWDNLVYGVAGRWKDVFSSPANTERQRRYNRNIRRSDGVYTPQMVIDGRAEAAGTRRDAVETTIRRVADDDRPRLEVAVTREPDGGLSVAVEGPATGPATEIASTGPAALWLVRFERARVTRVKAGENKDKTLTNHHVVTGLTRIGPWSGKATAIRLADIALSPDEGCAVLVQDDHQGPILGAAPCPPAMEKQTRLR